MRLREAPRQRRALWTTETATNVQQRYKNHKQNLQQENTVSTVTTANTLSPQNRFPDAPNHSRGGIKTAFHAQKVSLGRKFKTINSTETISDLKA